MKRIEDFTMFPASLHNLNGWCCLIYHIGGVTTASKLHCPGCKVQLPGEFLFHLKNLKLYLCPKCDKTFGVSELLIGSDVSLYADGPTDRYERKLKRLRKHRAKNYGVRNEGGT